MTRFEPTVDLALDDVHGTVLCVEDQPVNMALVENLLTRFPGVTLLKAVTGNEGVRHALAERPDLILLDMMLPDISGLDVVRRLCKEVSAGQLTIVLVTSDSFSIEVVKAMTLGAREYWTKPLAIDKLAADLPRVLRRARADRMRARAG